MPEDKKIDATKTERGSSAVQEVSLASFPVRTLEFMRENLRALYRQDEAAAKKFGDMEGLTQHIIKEVGIQEGLVRAAMAKLDAECEAEFNEANEGEK